MGAPASGFPKTAVQVKRSAESGNLRKSASRPPEPPRIAARIIRARFCKAQRRRRGQIRRNVNSARVCQPGLEMSTGRPAPARRLALFRSPAWWRAARQRKCPAAERKYQRNQCSPRCADNPPQPARTSAAGFSFSGVHMTELISPKLVRRQYGDLTPHEHWCPGCNAMHQIAVDTPFRNGARWTWDGNAAAPTFSPSVNITLKFAANSGRAAQVCRHFIRSGRIEFCADSSHALAGQTVDLPNIPADELDRLLQRRSSSPLLSTMCGADLSRFAEITLHGCAPGTYRPAGTSCRLVHAGCRRHSAHPPTGGLCPPMPVSPR